MVASLLLAYQLTGLCAILQRAKEIARNKKERKFLRDAHAMKSNPIALKEELKEVTDPAPKKGCFAIEYTDLTMH